jgi:hypothetical protein
MSGAHIAIAAAEQQKRIQEEEEQMTQYRPEDLSGEWEFKIVRSATSQFRKPEILQQLIAEEGLAGWEMLEKFGDDRVRFKRQVSARRKDSMLPAGVDAYRTQYGMSEGTLGGWAALGIVAAMALIIGVIALVQGGGF